MFTSGGFASSAASEGVMLQKKRWQRACLSGGAFFLFVSFISGPAFLQGDERFEGLVTGIESLRQRLGIPGCSLAVGYGDGSVEARGLGYADLEQARPATADTQYHIASLSKGFSALIALQLEAEGRLDLAFSNLDRTHFPDPAVSIRRVLSHGAMRGDAGFRYRSAHFMQLTPLLEAAGHKIWPAMLQERIFSPLGMRMTLPGREYFPTQDRLIKLARPYRISGKEAKSIALPSPECNTSYGIISTVLDLISWSRALDSDRLLSFARTRELFRRSRNLRGTQNPYALGWFVSDVFGEEIHWHYGWRVPGYGAVIVRIPTKGLTFVILANSDRLVSDATLSYGNPLRSIFILEFVRRYLLPRFPDEVYPPLDPDWRDTELIMRLSCWTNSPRHLYPEELMARSLVETRIGNRKNALRLMRYALTLFPPSRGLCDFGTLETLYWQRQEPCTQAAQRLGEKLLQEDPDDPWLLDKLAERAPPRDALRHSLHILELSWAEAGIRQAALRRIAALRRDDPVLLWRAYTLFGLKAPLSSKKALETELEVIRRHGYWLNPLVEMKSW